MTMQYMEKEDPFILGVKIRSSPEERSVHDQTESLIYPGEKNPLVAI